MAQYTSYSRDGIKFDSVYETLLLVRGTNEFFRLSIFTSEGTEFDELTKDPHTRKPVALSTATRTVIELREAVRRSGSTIEGATTFGDTFTLNMLYKVG